MKAKELAFALKSTAAFIDADAEDITITPAETAQSDGAGGRTRVQGEPFQATVRLIPTSDKVPVTTTWEGSRENVEYTLMALPEMRLLLTKGSTFQWRGQTWLITAIHDKPDYECKADVILHVG